MRLSEVLVSRVSSFSESNKELENMPSQIPADRLPTIPWVLQFTIQDGSRVELYGVNEHRTHRIDTLV